MKYRCFPEMRFGSSTSEAWRFTASATTSTVGSIADLSVEGNGDILLLAYSPPPESRCGVVRCNFRGEPTGKIEIKNLPSQFSGFSPARIVSLNNRLYLADLIGLKVVVTDLDGTFKDGYDIFSMLSLKRR